MREVVLRDEKGTAILDTPKRRIIFSLTLLFVFTSIIVSFVTLLFIPYWIFTGKNIFKQILDI